MGRQIVQPIRQKGLNLRAQRFRLGRNARLGECLNERNHSFSLIPIGLAARAIIVMTR
jgi:hypothetical protein